MKKFLAMVLAVCTVLSMAAFAEQGAVVQNELPPQAVVFQNADGENIVAQIFDAQGDLLAEIKEDGALLLTDVHQRSTVENEIVSVRLTDAYEGVMDGVHYSDVNCVLHEHNIKPDIDESVADLGIDAYDLVMYELFDVMLTDETAELLAEGNYLELTLEVEADESVPLVTMFTADGEKWRIIPTTNIGANRFTVQLTELGTLALLSDGRDSIGIGSGAEPFEGENLTDYSAQIGGVVTNFTPSVSGKSAPEMHRQTGSDGESYVGYIRNDAGDLEIGVPDYNYIIVTAVAESDYVVDIQTHEHLEWGYDDILEVEDVGDLFAEHDMNIELEADEHDTIAVDLDEVLAQKGYDFSHDQLVVKDLFEVTAYGDYLYDLYTEDHYLEITFDADLNPAQPMVVIHSEDSVHWHVHPIDEYQFNGDDSVTLKLYELGVVAFLVDAEEVIDEATAVQSPN